MKIAYVANHNQLRSADDEGAIAYALERLGHTVHLFSEKATYHSLCVSNPDMVLFHKWSNWSILQKLSCIKVAWYFDLFYQDEPELYRRNIDRLTWLENAVGLVDALFCTDGSAVNGEVSHTYLLERERKKVFHLTQGADSRLINTCEFRLRIAESYLRDKHIDILFTGSVRSGTKRAECLDLLRETYKERFMHVAHGAYRENLAQLILNSKVVVAPSAPVGPNYYSNRIYNALGFGACLIHPLVSNLSNEYRVGEDIYPYDPKDLKTLIQGINFLLEESSLYRQKLSFNGYETTLNLHTYEEKVRMMFNILRRERII